MAMKHIAGMAGLPGAKPSTEQHKFQLIYSREPAEIDTQPLEFGMQLFEFIIRLIQIINLICRQNFFLLKIILYK